MEKYELKKLYPIIIGIIAVFSSFFINKIISFSNIVNVSHSKGVNNMTIYLISLFIVVFMSFIISKCVKKHIEQK